MSLAVTVRAMVAAGATPEMILAVVEAHEAHAADALAQRRANDAARQKAKRSRDRHVTSRDVTQESRDAADGKKHNENKGCGADLARVRDNLPRLVISGGTDADDCASACDQSDDWPDAGLVEALVSEVASPRLDPAKQQGLTITSGRLAAWKREGASWRHDVVPVVKALCAKTKTPVASWKFFDAAIAQSIADNRQALTIPEARSTGPPALSITDRLAAEQAEVRRRTTEILEKRAARNG